MTSSGHYHTNPSQVSSQQKLVLIYTAELTGASQVKYLAQRHNTVVKLGLELVTFRLRVKHAKPLYHCATDRKKDPKPINIDKLFTTFSHGAAG